MRWDPQQYARYGAARGRPFFDLIAQIGAEHPSKVVDLGCGSGELTTALTARWPQASILGIDSSPEMIGQATSSVDSPVSFALGEAAQYDASGVDVLISNALLQWVPGHQQLLARWTAQLNEGGWLAFQVPDNFSARSHTLMRELAASVRWSDQLAGVLRHTDAVSPIEDYLALLTESGLQVDAWQTTYLHVLPGDNPVLEWVRGTGLRPILAALPAADAAEFEASYGAALQSAYPRTEFGTVFPFRRTFVVAHKTDRA